MESFTFTNERTKKSFTFTIDKSEKVWDKTGRPCYKCKGCDSWEDWGIPCCDPEEEEEDDDE